MIEKTINELLKAETREEILSYKQQILDLYDDLYEKICPHSLYEKSLCITNFEDIKMLHEMEEPMMAYYGPDFYSKCGIPFLKEHNSKTVDILELTVLFYSIQIIDFLENGFYDHVDLCIYESLTEVFDRTEEINLTRYKYKQNLFAVLWFYFMKVITIEGNREFSIEYDCDTDIFYLTDETYEEVLDLTYKNFNGSNYFHIINEILGIYRVRFTKMEYILKYQPLFVEVGYRYLCTLL